MTHARPSRIWCPRLPWGRAAAMLVAVLVVAACGPADDEVADPDPPEPTEEPDVPPPDDPDVPPPDEHDPDTAPPEPPVAGDAVTEEDDGTSVTLEAGGEIPLRLSNDWIWDEPQVRGDPVVELAPVDHFQDPGYQEWSIMAIGAGEADLVADGEPNCGDPDACPARTVTIHVEVTDAPVDR